MDLLRFVIYVFGRRDIKLLFIEFVKQGIRIQILKFITHDIYYLLVTCNFYFPKRMSRPIIDQIIDNFRENEIKS